jgi:hypothetical protein
MKRKLLLFLAINISVLLSFKANAQVSCSGTISANSVTTYGSGYTVIGNGTAGSIEICIASNTLNAACMGTSDVFVIDDNGSGTTVLWSSTTANGTCYTLTTTTGYAYLAFQNDGCAGTGNATISWTTVNACGDQICTGTPPACGGPICTTCAGACSTCGFTTAPTVTQVTSSCPDYPYNPPLATGSSATRCHTFTAVNTTVSFNVIISSNCGSGNVSAFSWTLQNSTCGGIIQSGTLSSLSFAGLTIGNQYTFCYTFTVPNPGAPTFSCTHTTHYPYFVGAAPLPIELISFDADVLEDRVSLNWTTASEKNNDFFTIERSQNGSEFETVSTIKGAGNSSQVLYYTYVDENPLQGTSYYRLKQTDFDGQSEVSDMVSVNVISESKKATLYPNPVTNSVEISFRTTSEEAVTLYVYDYSGNIKSTQQIQSLRGNNKVSLDTRNLPAGMYLLNISSENNSEKIRFIKE